MSPFAQSKLPQISRFLSGLVSNRNPADSPVSMIPGIGRMVHYDTLIDGENVELSAYDTLQRRPGWTSFLTTQAVDTWQYKDLSGNISLFVDTGFSLVQNNTTVISNSSGDVSAWSLVGNGNFLYGSNGVDLI